MCDASSFISAAGQMMQSNIQANMAQDKASFEAAQMRNQAILLRAQTRHEMTALSKNYEESMKENMAAAVVSGIGTSSFAPVMEGNDEDMRRNLGHLVDSRTSGSHAIALEADMMEFSGKMEAKALKHAGLMGAAMTLTQAEINYGETHKMGEGRLKHFGRSLGADKSKRFKSFYTEKEG